MEFWIRWGRETFLLSRFSTVIASKLLLPSPPFDVGLARWARRLSTIGALEISLGGGFLIQLQFVVVSWSEQRLQLVCSLVGFELVLLGLRTILYPTLALLLPIGLENNVGLPPDRLVLLH